MNFVSKVPERLDVGIDVAFPFGEDGLKRSGCLLDCLLCFGLGLRCDI